MEYAHKVSKLVIGKEYLVAHAKVKVEHYGNEILSVPIFPHFHQDLSFSNAPTHYHIDKRFGISPKSRYLIKLESGRPNDIITNSPTEKIIEVVFLIKKCLRTDNLLFVPGGWQGNRFREWYQSMIGKSCAGKRCPHYGTIMIEDKGKLYCPLHNLQADPKILKIVKPY